MSKKNSIPLKVYKNMLADNYKQSKKEYQKILEYQRTYHDPICQKEDRYIPPKTKGNVLSQEYLKKMAEKPEKAHIKRIPIKSNLTSSGVTVITEPDKPIGKRRQNKEYHPSSAQKRNLGKKIILDNHKRYYYDDFNSSKLNRTQIANKNKQKVRKLNVFIILYRIYIIYKIILIY